MNASDHAVRCILLAWAGLAGLGGCGVVDQARARVEALWSDEAEPEAPPEAVVPPEVTPEAVIASTGAAAAASTDDDPTGGAGTTGGPVEPVAGATSGSPGPSDSDATGSSDATGNTDATGSSTTAAGDEPETTGGDAPAAPLSGSPCLEGEWLAEDLHAYFRRDVERQAHGRPVKNLGESGRYSLRFAAGVVNGEAKHRRAVFSTRLAKVDIVYSVDVHGAFEAATRSEGAEMLVIDAPRTTTLRVRELVRFSGSKSESRQLTMPIAGRWQVTCAPGSLELRPLEDGKPGPALGFVRAKPSP